MGKVACKAILGKDIAVTKEHGRLLPYVYQDTGELCGVLITLHPSAPLHNPNWHEIIKQDMMSIARMRIIRTHLEKMLAVRGEEALPCIPMPQH
jgi:uracil-DNA glycosylase